MDRRLIASSMIKSWGYDSGTSLLEIEFHNGRIYQYSEVSEFIARGLELAESKGQFFQSKIDGRYPTQEVGR
jgi:hypothetical protein